ncbi:rod shape-determining protein [Patescibacteria group bacterium]|nr:rod shape-determining protein [Patescibacteria group bacterium]
MFSRRIAIDLGTTNTVVCVPKRGVVYNEPSVVAIQTSDNKIMAIGTEARSMLGRTPESIIAAHPLRDGVIANFHITESMLRYYINKVMGPIRLVRPEVMVTIPSGITSTERRAVIDATNAAGARMTYVIKGSLAAALGAGLQIASPSGNMIIDIGGGTTEIAVIALGDTVAVNSVRIGGNNFDQAIATHLRKKYNLIIGEQTAEEIKIQIGTAMPLKKELSMEVSGSNAISGLPESILIHSADVTIAIKSQLQDVMNAVKVVLQHTPPELSSDVMDRGIILTGGASQLRKLDELFTKVTGVPCQIAEDPSMCVAKGATVAIEHLDAFKRSVLWTR